MVIHGSPKVKAGMQSGFSVLVWITLMYQNEDNILLPTTPVHPRRFDLKITLGE